MNLCRRVKSKRWMSGGSYLVKDLSFPSSTSFSENNMSDEGRGDGGEYKSEVMGWEIVIYKDGCCY